MGGFPQPWGAPLSWPSRGGSHLKFLGALVAERLQGEAEVVVLRQRAQVEVVLSVDAGRDVDVELQQLQEVALHLVPEGGRSFT